MYSVYFMYLVFYFRCLLILYSLKGGALLLFQCTAECESQSVLQTAECMTCSFWAGFLTVFSCSYVCMTYIMECCMTHTVCSVYIFVCV